MVVGIGWNAGIVRARLLGLHRLGGRACEDLARLDSFEEALRELRDGPYAHDVDAEMTLPEAQWAVWATPLWHLRVLAGWLPPAGAELARVLAGWWEVRNIENLLAELHGGHAFPPYDLGRLDTTWNRTRGADSVSSVRAHLAVSPWQDPGADDVAAIVTWLGLSWAHRVAEEADRMARLAAGWAALVGANDLLVGARTHTGDRPHGVRELGGGWGEARDIGELRERLPDDARWVFDDIEDPKDLWRAEVRWWRRLDEESHRWLRHPDAGADAVLGAFGAHLADARRVEAALEVAARGRDSAVIDEVL